MKMSKELYSRIKKGIETALQKNQATNNMNVQQLYDKYIANGLNEMRFRWDLFWCIDHDERTQILVELAKEDLNDNHMDTAFRSIVKELLQEVK